MGRHPESEIFLDDITVSRRHAEFLRSGAAYLVKDVGSLNGTYVNRERIEEINLASGDEVQIGNLRDEWRLDDNVVDTGKVDWDTALAMFVLVWIWASRGPPSL